MLTPKEAPESTWASRNGPGGRRSPHQSCGATVLWTRARMWHAAPSVLSGCWLLCGNFASSGAWTVRMLARLPPLWVPSGPWGLSHTLEPPGDGTGGLVSQSGPAPKSVPGGTWGTCPILPSPRGRAPGWLSLREAALSLVRPSPFRRPGELCKVSRTHRGQGGSAPCTGLGGTCPLGTVWLGLPVWPLFRPAGADMSDDSSDGLLGPEPASHRHHAVCLLLLHHPPAVCCLTCPLPHHQPDWRVAAASGTGQAAPGACPRAQQCSPGRGGRAEEALWQRGDPGAPPLLIQVHSASGCATCPLLGHRANSARWARPSCRAQHTAGRAMCSSRASASGTRGPAAWVADVLTEASQSRWKSTLR